MKIAVLVLTTCLLSTSVKAETEYLALGFGYGACSSWTAARKSGGTSDAAAQNWMFGYVSGYNAFGYHSVPIGQQFVPGDEKSLISLIDSRCAAHPRAYIPAVIRKFIYELNKSYREHEFAKRRSNKPR